MLGWDSLETVDRIHRWAELSGILILAFLVVAEVIAFKYNSRKDFLVSRQQTAEKQSHDDEMSRIHLEAAKITEHAAELDREAAALRLQLDREVQKRAPRHLTDLQAETLRNAISPLLGECFVNIGTSNSSFEAVSFAQEIVHVVKSVRDKSASDSKDLTSVTGLVRGVAVVYVNGNKYGEKLAQAIVRVLNESGIAAFAKSGFDALPIEQRLSREYGIVSVIVGDKP